MLIAIEGLDNAGKRTQVELLAKYLRKKGRNVSIYRYPDRHGAYAEMHQKFLSGKLALPPTAQFLTFTADIAKDQTNIFKEMSAGKVVILDRYVFSTIAYQSLPFERATEAVRVLKFLKPDLVFFIEVRPEFSMNRIKKHAKTSKYEKDKERLLAASIKYKIMADQQFLGAWKVLDGTKKAEELSKEICSSLKL